MSNKRAEVEIEPGKGSKARGGTASSGAGSSNTLQANSFLGGHAGYQDEAKLLATIKQFSTLEGLGDDSEEDS